MRDLLGALAPEAPADPLAIAVRLLAAMVLGSVVAWIYNRTHASTGADGLPTTLVLLAVLIAMVTQVIGDNVARAFSLVGALSIVRFRTVVRDTRDTAFVIFSVVVGMAVGSQHPWVALIGLAVTGAVAFLFAPRAVTAAGPVFRLRVRASAGLDPERVRYLAGEGSRLTGMEVARQGVAMALEYEVRTPPDRLPEMVRALGEVDGVQEVRLQAAGESE
jgi:multisubunit Na+/H+ antiporter MnhG subunit